MTLDWKIILVVSYSNQPIAMCVYRSIFLVLHTYLMIVSFSGLVINRSIQIV